MNKLIPPLAGTAAGLAAALFLHYWWNPQDKAQAWTKGGVGAGVAVVGGLIAWLCKKPQYAVALLAAGTGVVANVLINDSDLIMEAKK